MLLPSATGVARFKKSTQTSKNSSSSTASSFTTMAESQQSPNEIVIEILDDLIESFTAPPPKEPSPEPMREPTPEAVADALECNRPGCNYSREKLRQQFMERERYWVGILNQSPPPPLRVYVPSYEIRRNAFRLYCSRYPLALFDVGFMEQHRFLFQTHEETEAAKSSPYYVPPCGGCPECFFGDAFNGLNALQKQIIHSITDRFR